ncbi:MAG: lysophospholipid acyltransferase family protein [Desulfovibrio sp.]|jgi:predicted LPLAT superfamily acyltransferase|nr:lysophospholipid acyltransferase family protein [Desulfovibrio sp.]
MIGSQQKSSRQTSLQHIDGWTSRSIGSRLQHAIFYRLIAIGGRKAAYALLFWVVLWFMFKPEAIRRSALYLARRFPDATALELWRHRWRLQWELGKTLVDRAVAGINEDFSVETDPRELEKIYALHSEGTGLIMLSAHIGAWQMSMSVLSECLSMPVSVVLYRDPGDLDRHYFDHTGETPSFSIIDPAGGPASAIAMVQTLQKLGLLCMMGDRPFGDSQLCRVPFMGGLISIPYTAYYLASVTGSPIVIFFSPRIGPGKVRNVIADVLRVPPGLGKKPNAYEPYARRYAKALEERVAIDPYQFFNFFNMWESHG